MTWPNLNIRLFGLKMERKKQKNKSNTASLLENGQASGLIHTNSDIKGDGWNILLLLFLYTLQGIPLGLSSAIPMILQNRGVSYKQQVIIQY